jgi:hypothetical protein
VKLLLQCPGGRYILVFSFKRFIISARKFVFKKHIAIRKNTAIEEPNGTMIFENTVALNFGNTVFKSAVQQSVIFVLKTHKQGAFY